MCMAIACDHLGWKLKAQRIQGLERQGHAVADLGCDKNEIVDYPDVAERLALAIR